MTAPICVMLPDASFTPTILSISASRFSVAGSTFTEPSTRAAVALLATRGKELPAVVVTSDEENVAKSFRNVDRVVVTTPGRLEVTALVWARSVLLTQDALELVEAKAANDSKAKAESS